MTKLFEATQINGMALANRFVRSATCEAMAGEDGGTTASLIDLMERLAAGGTGLIITGHAFVEEAGRAMIGQLGVQHNALIPGLSALAAAAHKQEGKIVLQLAHAGLFTDAKLTGSAPLVVSALDGITGPSCRELTGGDIERIVAAFAEAAVRAKKAGCDGVQLHAAHGYLLSQFLSPAFNHRTDEYGGKLENRARALLEILLAVRKSVGTDYPILVKLNCRDFIAHGLTLEDSLLVAAMLAEKGIDAIEISGGVLSGGALNPVRAGINREADEAYFLEEARAFRKKVAVPLILVGGIRSYHLAEKIIAEGAADYVALSRPLIREPGLINRWKSGDLAKAACLSDNLCFGPALEGKGLYCLMDK